MAPGGTAEGQEDRQDLEGPAVHRVLILAGPSFALKEGA